MKAAILILTNKSPLILKRLIHALDDCRFDIFVHVDAKSHLEDFCFPTYSLQHSRLFILPNRIKAYWGDISLSDAMIHLYRYALSKGTYQWFITLSGEDYPIQSNQTICDTLLQQHEDSILMYPCTPPRCRGYWFHKIPNKLLTRSIRKALSILGIRKKPYLTVNGEKWTVCHASQWHALTKESVLHLLSVYDRHPVIRRYFRFSHAPDEMVIPTILYNTPPYPEYAPTHFHASPLSFEAMACIHFLKYQPQKNTTVKILDESAYHEIISSQKLFVRKVQTGISDALLDRLDAFRNGG
ncbi:MAG: hypothetical protein IKW00_08990 [Clostridia bacterium]|nr:hypothetical protein [Clostridia bacterium]